MKEEIEPGNVSIETAFDDAYEDWKLKKLREEIHEVSKEWGMDERIFERSVIEYTVSETKEVPFMEDITNRSEERRVGKGSEERNGGWQYNVIKQTNRRQ